MRPKRCASPSARPPWPPFTASGEGNTSVTDPSSTALAADPGAPAMPATPTDPWARSLYFVDDVELHPALRELRASMPDSIVDVVRFRDETTIHVRREDYREVCRFLRDHPRLSFNFLTDTTAVDMLRLRETPRFDVVALLYSLPNRVRLRIKAGCNDGEPVPSLVPLWNGANWLERETYDMFGIVFEGHPNLRRMLLPDDWDEGHPLRKDYPLRGWREFPSMNAERQIGRVRTRWSGRESS
jgi:NADH-quinone oxidoreductase subunit C